MNACAGRDSFNRDVGYASCGRTCPRCNGAMHRIPRRFVDYLVSIFMTVHRYRCDAMNCSWEGCLRAKRHSRACGGSGVPYHERTYVLGSSRMGEGTDKSGADKPPR